jgi:hypothetical protein
MNAETPQLRTTPSSVGVVTIVSLLIHDPGAAGSPDDACASFKDAWTGSGWSSALELRAQVAETIRQACALSPDAVG